MVDLEENFSHNFIALKLLTTPPAMGYDRRTMKLGATTCLNCGSIFTDPGELEQHQSKKHPAPSEVPPMPADKPSIHTHGDCPGCEAEKLAFERGVLESLKVAKEKAEEAATQRARSAEAELTRSWEDPATYITQHKAVCKEPGCKIAAWEKAHDTALAGKLLADPVTVDAAYATLHPAPKTLEMVVR